MMMFLCGLLGLALAVVTSYLLHSWLVFAVLAVPLTALGMLFGWMWSTYSLQRRIVAHPELIDTRVEQAMRANQWREASRLLLLGARMATQAARDPGRDRETLVALAQRWEALARTCIQRDIDTNWDAFRAFRNQRRDHD
jgi:hypothetical protein